MGSWLGLSKNEKINWKNFWKEFYYEKNDNWNIRRLLRWSSHWPSDPVYYIEDCQIFVSTNSGSGLCFTFPFHKDIMSNHFKCDFKMTFYPFVSTFLISYLCMSQGSCTHYIHFKRCTAGSFITICIRVGWTRHKWCHLSGG